MSAYGSNLTSRHTGVVGLSSHLGCVLDGEVLEGLILSVVVHLRMREEQRTYQPQLSSEEATDPISRASKFVVDIILRNIAVLGVGGELVVNGDVVGDLLLGWQRLVAHTSIWEAPLLRMNSGSKAKRDSAQTRHTLGEAEERNESEEEVDYG